MFWPSEEVREVLVAFARGQVRDSATVTSEAGAAGLVFRAWGQIFEVADLGLYFPTDMVVSMLVDVSDQVDLEHQNER